MERIIFLRVAWMENYDGSKNATINSDVNWIKSHGYCYEMFNFFPDNGEFRGYVEPKGSIRIERLDKTLRPNDEYIENITVVWVSSSPYGGTYIIGWYLNATIYRKEQIPEADTHRIYQGNKISFNVKAKVKDCVLLPVSERTMSVPTGKGGIGQSNIWYADDPLNSNHMEYRKKVSSFIKLYYKKNSIKCLCGAIIPVTRFTAGKKGRCSKCGKLITIGERPELTIQEPAEKEKNIVKHGEALTVEEVFNTAIKTVVYVQHDRGHGSGVIVNPEGLIITNKHVVTGGHNTLKVKLFDGTLYHAKIIRYYRDIDLAFLKIESQSNDYVNILPQGQAKIGERVLAIGNPLEYEGILTDGIVSKINHNIDGRNYLQHTAPINPGNSGGPLLSKSGVFLGINTWGRNDADGMYFAIPNQAIWEKLNTIEHKIDYINSNYFCQICGNTSFNHNYCDHCGIKLEIGENVHSNDTFTVKCDKCQKNFDEDISICPNCSSSINQEN